MSQLVALLAERAVALPDAVALVEGGETVTLAGLMNRIDAEADRIRAVAPGTAPIGIALPNGIAWIVADLAILRLGRACVPLPSFFLPDQAALALADSGASAVIGPNGIDLLDARRVDLPTGTAKISYTSGSTGTPKGICLSERQLLTTAQAVIARLGADKAGRHLPVLPLGVLLENVAGLYASLLSGGVYIAEPGTAVGLANPFAPDFAVLAAAIDRDRVTSVILVPELLRGLVAWLETHWTSLPSLTLAAVGGARVPIALLDGAAAIGLPVVQGYGLTECGSVVAIEQPNDTVRGSVGQPLDHISLCIDDDGEIVIDGNTHLGRVGDRRLPGPLRTGDLGSIDPDGRLFVSGRKSNLIVTGFGRNISPEWVESELLTEPEIAQAMVFGDGEAQLSALIVPRSAETDPSPAVARVNAALPVYARIGQWELSRPFLPHDNTLTTNGRPRRAEILNRRESQPFFDRLVMRTAAARGRLQSVPQLRAGLRGEIGLETYIAYLTQAYHHVRHTVPLMRAARAGLLHRPDLIAALDDYIAEETGHEQWILDDIAAAGGDPEEAVAQGPSTATAAMVDHAYRTICEGDPIAFFGMVFVLEGTSIALATRGAEAVRTSLGLPKSAFRYLTSHGALDQDHMRFFEGLVNRLGDPADQQAILTMANEIFDLFAGIFADIPMETVRVHA
jgi:long-subunit acyl-CoA synthetase (AMP-forming)/pyrroloquinoline quinone (PQQ) biosynthesis protein C